MKIQPSPVEDIHSARVLAVYRAPLLRELLSRLAETRRQPKYLDTFRGRGERSVRAARDWLYLAIHRHAPHRKLLSRMGGTRQQSRGCRIRNFRWRRSVRAAPGSFDMAIHGDTDRKSTRL